MQAELAWWRGDWDLGRRLFEEARQAAAESDDPQTMLTTERRDATIALFEGRGRDAFVIGKRHFLESPFAPGLSAAIAVEGAALEGDPDLLAEASGFLGGLAGDPPYRRGIVAMVGGITQIKAGDHEAGVESILRGVESLDAVDGKWPAFEAHVLGARALPPSHPLREMLIDRARERAEAAGAPGLVRWLEDMTR